MDKELRRSHIELHVAVLLFGFTAILGELIQLPALVLTWWRVILTSLFFLVLPGLVRKIKNIPPPQRRIFAGIGVIVALHWLTFYGAIKVSNASITLICLATTSFFTALIEPLVLGRSFSKLEIFSGLFIIPGMILIVQSTDTQLHLGILLGLISAVLSALFGSLNKKHLHTHGPVAVTWIELASAAVFLSICLPIFFTRTAEIKFLPGPKDWFYLLLLSLLCTNLAYVLALRSLRKLSAFFVALTVNLEPIYGIILAVLFLGQHEQLHFKFYLGALIILTAVFGYSIIKRRYAPRRRTVIR